MTLEVQTRPKAGSVVFAVHVQPRAAKSGVAGVHGKALKVRIHAPAVENRANEELCAFLAGLLKRPKSAVRLLSGEHGRNKRVEIFGVSAAEIMTLVQLEA